MNKLEEKTYKILSYCDIPEELTENTWLQEVSCDVYVMHNIQKEILLNDLDNWIITTYPELVNIPFLIHMDY